MSVVLWPDNIPNPHAATVVRHGGMRLFAYRQSRTANCRRSPDSVENATARLESRGYRLLIKNKKEPWGQTVSRFLSPEGLLVGVTFTPGMREEKEE